MVQDENETLTETVKKAAAQNERLTADIQSYVNKNKDLKDKVMRLESALEKVGIKKNNLGFSWYKVFAFELYFCQDWCRPLWICVYACLDAKCKSVISNVCSSLDKSKRRNLCHVRRLTIC